MKKYLIIAAATIMLAGCVQRYPIKPIIATSQERNTEIWLDDEYQGKEYTVLRILNSKSKDAYVKGKKSGCPEKKLKIEYKFDVSTLWIVNPSQLWRLLTWDVYIVDPDKDLYNVTPECSR